MNILPDFASNAAPTRKFEYGAYALWWALRACFTNWVNGIIKISKYS